MGKGITFDAGGLNIKLTGSMETMYCDKGGACAVLGALLGCLELGIKKNIIFSMAFAENAIGSRCYKPSDILTSLSGLTVEVGNTDAEGRLVMADTMTYVQRNFAPKKVIDLATLTGGALRALGNTMGALFSNDADLAKLLLDRSHEMFEPLWQLPITKEARDDIVGRVADINNTGTNPLGAAAKAAAFLERFVEGGTKWAHLDIAGGAFMSIKAEPPLCQDATGFGT